jgi:hypothetical protein
MLEGLVASLASKGLGLLAGAVAKRGTDFIKEKTGIDLSATAEVTDDEASMLREFQETNQVEILAYLTAKDQTNLERERLTFTDTSNARAMQIAALGSTSSFGKLFVYIMASYLLVVSTVYVGYITFGTIPEANVRFADVILGFLLGTVISSVINFFLGSSRSAQTKDDTIARALHG